MPLSLNELKKHWEDFGRKFPTSGKITPTSRDPFLGELEEDCITGFLEKNCSVLEIGCGDGAHTLKYSRLVNRITAMDLVERFIEIAKKRAADEAIQNIHFITGSVTNLNQIFQPASFDRIISQRCLINLPTWEHQRTALLDLHTLLKPGGLLLLTEGFVEELDELNAVRQHIGLEPIRVVEYNRNFQHDEFDPFIQQYFDQVSLRDYGSYLFFSRVFHPLAVLPESPRHDSPLNAAAMLLARSTTLPDMRKFSYNLFYTLRKK